MLTWQHRNYRMHTCYLFQTWIFVFEILSTERASPIDEMVNGVTQWQGVGALS